MVPVDQMARIAAEVKSNLKLPEDQASIIERYVRRSVNGILIFCNRKDLPELLEDTAAQMCEDMLRADKMVERDSEVASIARGDTSITYKDGDSSYQNTLAFLKNYEVQLIRYRKINLPEDRP